MFAPLAVADFRLLFLAMVIGQALMPLQFVTQIFWVQESVGVDVRIVLVGLIGTTRGAGQLTFGLYGGALADRFDRRRLLIITQSLGVCLTLSIAGLMAVSDATPLALLVFFALAFLSAGIFAINAPTRQALIPEIVGEALVPRAIALSVAGIQTAIPFALFASGLLVEFLGFAVTFALSGIAQAAEVTMLLLMRHRSPSRAAQAGARPSALRDVREGLRYTRRNPTVMWTIVLMVAMVGLGFPAVANMGPTWITTVVGQPYRNFGFIALTWAIGSFTASTLLARFAGFERTGALVVVGAIGFALSFVFFSSGHTVAFAVVGNLGLGASMSLAQVSASALILNSVPNEVRGRVMSLMLLNMSIAQLITFPLAAIGQAVTLQVLFPVLAVVCLTAVTVIAVSKPCVWQARITARAQELPAETPAAGS
jgi:MFS family permease